MRMDGKYGSHAFFILKLYAEVENPEAILYSMKVIAVYGKPDVGKSTACYKLYELLIHANAKTLYSDPPKVTNPSNQSTKDKDFKVMLEYQNKRILITSDGDDCSIIANNVARAISQAPDAFVFAIRRGVWYKSSLSQLQNSPDNIVSIFTLPEKQTVQEKDIEETRLALSIFNLLP